MLIRSLAGLAVFWVCVGCAKEAPNSPPQIQKLIEREQAAAQRAPAEGLRKLRTIEFQVVPSAEEAKALGGEPVPWISLQDAEQQLPRLKDGDAVVLEHERIRVVIDYPLKKAVEFPLGEGTKFTRAELVRNVSRLYHEIYEEEERTATVKTIPPKERKIMNRNETDGKYGIWGHDLSDLDLSSIDVHERSDGALVLTLNIES